MRANDCQRPRVSVNGNHLTFQPNLRWSAIHFPTKNFHKRLPKQHTSTSPINKRRHPTRLFRVFCRNSTDFIRPIDQQHIAYCSLGQSNSHANTSRTGTYDYDSKMQLAGIFGLPAFFARNRTHGFVLIGRDDLGTRPPLRNRRQWNLRLFADHLGRRDTTMKSLTSAGKHASSAFKSVQRGHAKGLFDSIAYFAQRDILTRTDNSSVFRMVFNPQRVVVGPSPPARPSGVASTILRFRVPNQRQTTLLAHSVNDMLRNRYRSS